MIIIYIPMDKGYYRELINERDFFIIVLDEEPYPGIHVVFRRYGFAEALEASCIEISMVRPKNTRFELTIFLITDISAGVLYSSTSRGIIRLEMMELETLEKGSSVAK
jgi:hypothetical protein